ncbi:hypothetical protein DOZ80_01300 [Pseudomonas fluorescens]|uniref:Uncharacterized protein n=1 Tax=Pseudomonas fluorescens TaxID=294 RepID=A0A327NAE7_PSEFL|nr:hypothetical protein DOZ80_01300 [Pseudomonas fluorescens]
MARELAPAGVRSAPQHSIGHTLGTGFTTAAQPSGSKLPRHKRLRCFSDLLSTGERHEQNRNPRCHRSCR